MRLLLLMAALGLTACAKPAPIDSGVCAGLKRPVADLRSALMANPQTPQAVGEAGTDTVLGYEAGCS
jgi:hypothetical protein